MLERLNEEIRRRTYVARIFPNEELFAAGAGADHRAARGLARGPSLPQHGSAQGTQEGGATPDGLTMLGPTKGNARHLLRRRRSPAARLGETSDGGSEGIAQPDPMINFAELDAQNFIEQARRALVMNREPL
ncbi:transposase [Bradyrhizobium sp. LMG 9283]|uniref:transposase n=1 Tax=Bradyrhizobium sp. LMG 9283 TaxID=592064 RepID=UPI00388F457C